LITRCVASAAQPGTTVQASLIVVALALAAAAWTVVTSAGRAAPRHATRRDPAAEEPAQAWIDGFELALIEWRFVG
jgi:hypothetical protein